MFGIRKWIKWAYQQRSPRIFLIPLHNIKFSSEHPDFLNARVKNVSTHGLGFETDSLTAIPHKHQQIEGQLHTPQGELPITFEVIHVTGNTVGVEIGENQKEYEKFILGYLAREIQATQMQEVRPSSVKQHPEGATRLWNGGEDCGLYLVTNDEGQVILFELIFYGNVISGGKSLRFLKANTHQSEHARFKGFGGSQILSGAETLSAELRDGLIKFIFNIHDLPQGQAQQIIYMLQKEIQAA